MKKIAVLVNSASNGGGEKIAVEMANQLAKKDYQVDLILIEDKVTYEIDEKVTVITFKSNINFLPRFISLFKAGLTLNKGKYDAVISHLYLSNYLNATAGFFSNYLSIGVTHGSISKYSTFSIKNIVNKLAIKLLMSNLNKRVFLTSGMLEDFSYYITSEENYVIPNGYRINKIIELSQREKPEVPFEKGDYFTFIGRIHSVKNLHQIIKACIKSSKNLVIIGEGPELLEMKNISAGHKNIHFSGRLENPFPVLKDSKSLILASKSEGFPNVIIEALALGVTVISSDCRTGPREILNIKKQITKGEIVSNEAGVLFFVDDFASLSKIAKDIDKFSFSESYKKEIANIYSLESMCARYEKLLGSL